MPVLRIFDGSTPDGFRDVSLARTMRLGKRDDCEIVVSDARVSRRHCTFAVTPAGVVVTDAGSTNGILVNRARIDERTLAHGDHVVVGQTLCVLLEETSRPVPDVAALYERCREAGIEAPPVPPRFAAQIVAFGRWWWGTRKLPGLYMAAHALLNEEEPGEYWMFGYDGHGVNSYAIHYFVSEGPLQLLLEIDFGGAYSDKASDVLAVNAAFVASSALLTGLPQIRRRLSAGQRLVVHASTLRESSWEIRGPAGQRCDGFWMEVLQKAQAWCTRDGNTTGSGL